MTALEEIKKALEGVTPERVERMWWLLHILAKSTGTTNAEDDKWNWINAFCTDYEDDTFNLAAKLGFISVRHDSFMETSTARITKAGMALVAHFDKAPSAALTSTLESLQRENEELRQRLDIGPCGEDAIDVAESAADHLRVRAEAAEAEVKRLQAEIDRKSSMPGDHRYWEGRYRDEAAENEKLREALTPFGTVGAVIDGPFGTALFADKDMAFQSGCAWSENGERKTLTWGDFRRARTVLASTGGEHNAE